MTNWAVRLPSDAVLEPACGEAVFMEAAARRLSELGAEPSDMHISGMDIHEPSAHTARQLLRARGVHARVKVGDFLASSPTPTFDAVIGNPPYIRFHDFSGPSRATAIESALRLKLGGRLAFVLPAELLAANYASDVRRYLLERFSSVHLIMFEEQIFPGVMTEAVLLLCEGDGGTDHFTVRQLRSALELEHPPHSLTYRPASYSDKWTGALLSGLEGPQLLNDLASASSFVALADWGRISLGSVTGNNSYFALTPQRAKELDLQAAELVRISPPGSHHLRGIRLTSSALTNLGRAGNQTLLFRPLTKPSRAALSYIRLGESAGVDEAYKCRMRSPWWQVPQVQVADLLITCMNADTPRLAVNEARVRHLNSVHGLYLNEEHRELAPALAVASLNSATLLGAELVGRAYGGGILKLEPGEAVKLPLPSPEIVRAIADELTALTPTLRKLIANGLLMDAVGVVDAIVLQDRGGLSIDQLVSLREARAHLAERRVTRGGRAVGTTGGS
jgi:hypothetical protein